MGRMRDNRLHAELELMRKLTDDSSFVEFKARGEDGEHPEEYIVTFSCRGLRVYPGPPIGLPMNWQQQSRVISDEHVVYIYLPATFPKTPPQVRFRTPVFHPNIKQFPDTMEQLFAELSDEQSGLLEQSGGLENLMLLIRMYPMLADQIFASYVCIDVLFPPEREGSYSPKVTLYDLCTEIGKMIMYQRYNLAHGLNKQALQWTKLAEPQKTILPIDNRPFLDKLPPLVRILDTEEAAIDIIIDESEQL